MRIVCPSCQAAYEVPDKLLAGSPRKVRCARCGGDWVPEPVPAPTPATLPATPPGADDPPGDFFASPPPEPNPASPEPDLPPPPPVLIAPASPPAASPAPRAVEKLVPAPGGADDAAPRDRRLVMVAGALWLASLAAIATATWAAFAYRDDIMAAWAPSRRLFSLLGLG